MGFSIVLVIFMKKGKKIPTCLVLIYLWSMESDLEQLFAEPSPKSKAWYLVLCGIQIYRRNKQLTQRTLRVLKGCAVEQCGIGGSTQPGFLE